MTALAICLPCRDMVHTGFAYDLARLTAYWTARNVPQGGRLHLFTCAGTLIADQREKLVKEALKANVDWLLWIDSDMRFPKDGADRLMAHGKPVVAANYATRRLPVETVAFKTPAADAFVYTYPESTGLEKIHAVGMGFMLVKAEVYRKALRPWHDIHYIPANGDHSGEDMHFCAQARAAGFDILIDHDVSKEVQHIGQIEFTHDHAVACIDDVQNRGAA